MIREKFPEYPTGWVGAIRDGVFWGIKPEETNAYEWTWYYPTENQKAMEYIVNDIFNLNTDTDYIELDDIVL